MTAASPSPEQPPRSRVAPVRRRSRRHLPGDRPPFYSLTFAAAIGFGMLWLAPIYLFPLLSAFVPEGENLGPLALPIFTGALFEALVGTAVLTVLGLLSWTAEQHREFPDWLPLALSFPIAGLLILPSAVEHGGPWLAWVVFAALLACAFCFHWIVLGYARGIWD